MQAFLLLACAALLAALALVFILRVGNLRATAATAAAPRWRLLALLLWTAVAALSVYLALGTPHMPSFPLSPRLQGDPASLPVPALAARIENRLSQNPQDLKGWEVLGIIRLRQNRFFEAEQSFRRALALEETEAALSGLGEALAMQAGGMVTKEARLLFLRARAADPAAYAPAWFLGLAAKQEGKREDARLLWQSLLERLPQDSPEYQALDREMKRLKTDD